MHEDKNEDEMTAIKLLKKTEQQIAVKDKVTDEKAQETNAQRAPMD
jgi:hypothetical protein